MGTETHVWTVGDAVEVEIRTEAGKHWVLGSIVELGLMEGLKAAHVRADSALEHRSFWLPVTALCRPQPRTQAREIRNQQITVALRRLAEIPHGEDGFDALGDWAMKHRALLALALQHLEECPYNGIIVLQD